MMDPFVSSILKEWGLEDITTVFQANAIDEESFRLLDPESIKDLIPRVGIRLKFLQRFNQFNKQDIDLDSSASSSVGTIILPTSNSDQSYQSQSDVEESLPSKDGDGKHKIIAESSGTKMGKKFNVRKILEDADQENTITQLEEGTLGSSERRKMVRVLVSHLIENYGMSVGTDVKISLARAIVDEFPKLKDSEGEGYEAWYTKSSGRHPATGYLEERLRNVRKRSLNFLEKNAGVLPLKLKKTSTPVNKAAGKKEPEFTDEEISKMIVWMKSNHSPVEKVKDFMRNTQPKRAEWLQKNKSTTSLHELLNTYPRLLDTPGMIEQDFLLQVSPISLKEVWTLPLSEKVVAYAKSQDPRWESKLCVTGYDKGDIQCISIQLLPIILSSGTITTNEGKKVRATVSDALAGFVEVKPVGTNIPQYIEGIQNNTHRKQPFVLIMGERNHPTQSFAIIESSALPAVDIIEAIDICFKSFYVLDISYPSQCNTSWEFIQRFVFQLSDGRKGKGATSPSVRSLRAYLTSTD